MRFILLLSVVMFLSACGGDTQGSKIVAIVEGEKITMAMLDAKIDELPEYYRVAATQHKKEVLNDLIIEKLLYDAAKKRKLDKDEDVQKLIDVALKKILIARLLDIETQDVKPVSDEETELYYRQNKERFLVPEKVRASHILLSSKEEANKVKTELNGGADFAELAKKYSTDLTKDRGGDLGFFQKGQMIPEFEKVCFELKPGEISDIVETRFGYHLIKLTEKSPEQYMRLDEVRDKVKSVLIEQSKQELFKDYVEALKGKARIDIKEDVFDSPKIEQATSAKEDVQ